MLSGGTVELWSTLVTTNYDAETSGIGVVNLGGQVQCDVEHCLPICTICLDVGWVTLSPTSQPATSSTNDQKATVPTVIASISALLVLVLVGLSTVRHRLNATSVTCDDGLQQAAAGGVELPDTTSTRLTSHLLEDSSVQKSPDPHVSFELLRASRAAIFVVDRSMRVELWSAGNFGGDAQSEHATRAWINLRTCLVRYEDRYSDAFQPGWSPSFGTSIRE